MEFDKSKGDTGYNKGYLSIARIRLLRQVAKPLKT